MRKGLSIAVLVLLVTTWSYLAYSQETDPSVNSVNQQTVNFIENEEAENQQINKDEGYGSDDAEYYNAEGVNGENPK